MPAANHDPLDDSLGPRKRRVPLDDNGEPIVAPSKKRKSATLSSDKTKEQTSQKNPATDTHTIKTSTSFTGRKSWGVEIEEVNDPDAAPRASPQHMESTDDEDFPEVIEQPEEDDEEELSE